MKMELKTNTNRKLAVLFAGGALTLALAGGVQNWSTPVAAQTTPAKYRKAALSTAQMIASIRTAVAAKPGRVTEAAAEYKNGRLVCEVEIIGNDGKQYEVDVNVATNRVAKIKLDD